MDRGQAERLMPMLEEVLGAAGAAWEDLGAVGVCTGPGNFTGLRVAVAAARGLALGLGVPAEGVPAAEALAWSPDGARRVLVCLPAPRGRVVAGPPGEAPLALDPEAPGLALPEDWRLPCTGPEAPRLAAALGLACVPPAPVAPSVARIAAARAAPGRPRPAPLYLRAAAAAPPADPPPRILSEGA
jgi:tRNA threonylcarbamoyl adenosine modification protein YeaZ